MASKLVECQCGEQHPIDDTTLWLECAFCDKKTWFPEHIYQGPGVYQHYKGGIYIVFGMGKLEYNERRHVAYMTLDKEHQQDNWYAGLFCIFRPLNPVDGPDSWNSMVPAAADPVPGEDRVQMVPRFVKVI